MKRLLLFVAIITVLGCGEEFIWVSKGSRVPPKIKDLSSKEIENYFTQRYEGKDLAVISTFIDFSYIRALRHERKLKRSEAKLAFDNYIKKQTTFFVYIYLLDIEMCPASLEKVKEFPPIYDMNKWQFVLEVYPKVKYKRPFKVNPVFIKPIKDNCVLGGYVHFPGSLKTRDNLMKLSITSPDNKYNIKLQWKIKVVSKKKYKKRKAKKRTKR